MVEVKIRIKNIAQIRRAFSMAPSLMRRNLGSAITRATLLVKRESQIRSPVDTGRLRGSHITRVNLGYTLQGIEGIVEPTVNYAIYVHEGTRYMRPRPFLRLALESQSSEINRLLTEATQNTLDTIGRAT